MTTRSIPVVDLDLSRRLELAEGKTNAAFVDSHARLLPESGASWIEQAGTLAMFDGVGSPLTQTFGLGIAAEVRDADFDVLEGFFRERGAEVFHEVSPLTDLSLMTTLHRRGYRPVEVTSVMYRPLADLGQKADSGKVMVRNVDVAEADRWSEISARGWGETAELAEFMRNLGAIIVRSHGTHAFLGELEGEPVAAGAMSIHDGVALLAGASTIPERRGLGAQRALLGARLQYAVARGADLAMMAALPGSGSQRNAEREGFRIAYTRIKWQLDQSQS